MSAEKRQQLIEAGQLGPNGERLHRCPTCGKDGYEPPRGEGDAVATLEPHVAGVEVGALGEDAQ